MVKYVTYGSFVLLLALVDIIVNLFNAKYYPDWIFYILYILFSFVLISVNSIRHSGKFKNMMRNFIFTNIYIVITILSFTIFIPAIYSAIYNTISDGAPILIVHIFPFIDLFFYALLILISKYLLDRKIQQFI